VLESYADIGGVDGRPLGVARWLPCAGRESLLLRWYLEDTREGVRRREEGERGVWCGVGAGAEAGCSTKLSEDYCHQCQQKSFGAMPDQAKGLVFLTIFSNDTAIFPRQPGHRPSALLSLTRNLFEPQDPRLDPRVDCGEHRGRQHRLLEKLLEVVGAVVGFFSQILSDCPQAMVHVVDPFCPQRVARSWGGETGCFGGGHGGV
jgi:hypothetical protein